LHGRGFGRSALNGFDDWYADAVDGRCGGLGSDGLSCCSWNRVDSVVVEWNEVDSVADDEK
jgi:hypothetical protein